MTSTEIINELDTTMQQINEQNTLNDNSITQLDYIKKLIRTRQGMLHNIKNINEYNKKLIYTLIAILFAIIIIITSVVVLGNK